MLLTRGWGRGGPACRTLCIALVGYYYWTSSAAGHLICDRGAASSTGALERTPTIISPTTLLCTTLYVHSPCGIVTPWSLNDICCAVLGEQFASFVLVSTSPSLAIRVSGCIATAVPPHLVLTGLGLFAEINTGQKVANAGLAAIGHVAPHCSSGYLIRRRPDSVMTSPITCSVDGPEARDIVYHVQRASTEIGDGLLYTTWNAAPDNTRIIRKEERREAQPLPLTACKNRRLINYYRYCYQRATSGPPPRPTSRVCEGI